MSYKDYILTQRKFDVTISGNSVMILNTRTGFCKQHNIEEFVCGRREKTEKYPAYVHGEVWRQWGNK